MNKKRILNQIDLGKLKRIALLTHNIPKYNLLNKSREELICYLSKKFNEKQMSFILRGLISGKDVREIAEEILRRKIKDEKVIWLIIKILKNFDSKIKGMPLGNMTSQFFANVYLNDLDQFIKRRLKVKNYLRYVDDFVILHESKEKLEEYKSKIEKYLMNLN
jgi:hypothetical protein